MKQSNKHHGSNEPHKGNLKNIEEIEPFFTAKSLAIIGASANLAKPGGLPLKALMETGYRGDIYLVNPQYSDIHGYKCYPSVSDIPAAEIDLAIIVVSAEYTPQMLQQCAERGVKGVIIFTSGFSEVGEEGRRIEEEMVKTARSYGMRIMGPNCLGMINNANGLWASFARQQKYRENLYPYRFNLISQSGFFGAFIYQLAGQMKFGFNYFASVGNQADLGFTDFFSYMVNDPQAQIISGYIEGLKEGEGQCFLQAARQARRQDKPVVIMKVGRTGAGASAASSHTGSLAGEDHLYDAAFCQGGIIRAEGLEQLLSLLNVAVAGRWPRGKRAAIISASGGGAVILADKCAQKGLEVVELSAETRQALDEMLPFFASSANPVDLTARVMVERDLLYRSLQVVEKDPHVDVLLLSFQLGVDVFESVSRQLAELYQEISKPVVLIGYPFGDPRDVHELLDQMRSAGVPVIDSIDNGVWAVSALADWIASREDVIAAEAEIAANESDSLPLVKDRQSCADILLTSKDRHLTEYRASNILRAYGIKTPRGQLAVSEEEAVSVADEIGYPVTLKVQSPAIIHKTDLGGVVLNLSNGEELRRAWEKIYSSVENENLQSQVEGILVQEMLKPAVEAIIGMKRDAIFGPTIMFGLGGIFVEVMQDVSFRIAPLTRRDAWNMISSIRGHKILAGWRGDPPADLESLVETLIKFSRLACDWEEIAEMDVNPLFVYPKGQGVVAGDVLITFK